MKLVNKIAAMLVFVSLVPILLLGAAATYFITDIRDEATGEGTRMLIESGRLNLARLVEENAFGINQFCKGYYDDIVGLRGYFDFANSHYAWFTGSYRDDLYPDRPHPGLPGYGYVHPSHRMYGDFDRRFPTTTYLRKSVVERALSDTKLNSEISTSLHKAKLMEPIFVSLAKKYPATLDLVWIVLDNSVANVCPPYDLDAMIAKDPAIADLNESENVYLRLLNPDNNPERRIVWLQPYLDPYKRVWITSCITPLYDGGAFLGSMGMDISLSTIREKVLHIGIGREGYAFLIDSKGLPLALPPQGIEDLAWGETQKRVLREIFKPGPAQEWTQGNIDATSTTALIKSPHSKLSRVIHEMMSQRAGIAQVGLSGEEKLVAYAPIQNPGWSLGLVIPLKEILAPAVQAGQTIGEGTRRISWNFIGAFFVVCAVSVALGWLTKLQITPKVRHLVGITRDISKGKLDLPAPRKDGRDEFAEIEGSLAEMASLLEEKEARIKAYTVNLEALIRERTEEIRNS